MLKLHLGCNDDHRQGWTNVDIAPPADVLADLNLPWPWEDGSVERILANDVFEHIHGHTWNHKLWVLNQAHRVLMPGGILEFTVPGVKLADGTVNDGADADPTHVSRWTMCDHYYYCEEWNNPAGERGRLGPNYGITALFRIHGWSLIEYGDPGERRSKIHAVWEALK